MLKKKEKMVRRNTHILPSQDEFIRALAKKTGARQGDVYREIIQFYIDSHK